MPEHDPLVFSFSHLKDFPREKEALHTLQKVASLVKPIMRARGWNVGELAEFWPDQANLLGLNVNKGQKILLRLRYPGDRNQFLPIEQVTDTMLHELSHIVHGPHDGKFHALWNQLRDEHEGLVRKGYSGEGFLSEGHRLGGGGRIPMNEARRLARQAAEKRRVLSAGSGQRLGGARPRPGQDIRNVIADAIERRNETLRGCGNTSHDEKEIHEISETATRNGFKTRAEEDAANDAAIAQALWELVQEDEKAKYGDSYIPPSAQNPEGNGGGAVMAGSAGSSGRQSYGGRDFSPERRIVEPSANPPRRIVEPSARPSQAPPVPGPETRPSFADDAPAGDWTCAVCTLHNLPGHLACDACGTERPAGATNELAVGSTKRPRNGADLASRSARPAPNKPQTSKVVSGNYYTAKPDDGPAYWQCSFCGSLMERQWWTCGQCGTMKDSSR